MTSVAIYPGTFDPMTLGHFDLIERSAEIFDNLVLGVASDSPKDAMFSLAERLEMAHEVVSGIGNVRIESFNSLLVDFARAQGAGVLIRGLRAYSDFEYEFQMALTNRKLAPEIETLFMMPKEIHSYVSSSTVREVVRFGGDSSQFVPPEVQAFIERKAGTVSQAEKE